MPRSQSRYGFFINSIFCRIKSIPIQPYFIRINTMTIANTVIYTFNIRIFNIAKMILMSQKNTLLM